MQDTAHGIDDMNKSVIGRITGDPAENAPAGLVLKFEGRLVTHTLEDKASWLQEWDSFKGMLLSLHFGDAKNHSVDGSAIMVAPGIALCARHVLDQHWDAITAGKIEMLGAGITPHGLRVWKAKTLATTEETDIAIVTFTLASDLPPDNTFARAQITTRLPRIGEKLLIAGFRASEPASIDEDGSPSAAGNVLACVGEVTARYPMGRDSAILTWPTIEVDCPSWGGMSGGPVFDSSGQLVGILSTSFETGDDTGPSYVSLIWPTLGTQFEGGWPSGMFPGRNWLLGLDPRLCSIDRRDVVRVTQVDASRSNYTYEAWE